MPDAFVIFPYDVQPPTRGRKRGTASVFDEAHHSAADSWQKVHAHFPKVKVINLAATPFRSDAKKIGGGRLYRYPFRSAVVKGYIKQLTAVYVSPREIELTFKGDIGRTEFGLVFWMVCVGGSSPG